MKKRPLIYLGLAIVLILVILWVERPDQPRTDDVKDAGFTPNFAVRSVENCVVEQVISGTQIRRMGDGWEVADYKIKTDEDTGTPQPLWHRADTTRVNSAIANFTDLPLGVIVSKNPEAQSKYQVGPAGLKVVCKDKSGKDVIDVVIGKNGPDFMSSYIRRGNSPDVRLINRSLMGVFSPVADDWRDRTLWSINPVDIVEVDVKIDEPENNFKMLKVADDKWQIAGDETLEISIGKAKDIVTNLADLRIEEFVDGDKAKENSERAEMEFILTMKNGNILDLIIGKKDKDGSNYYARLKGDDAIYLINKESIDQIPLNVREN
ncbi:MAG: DUF4340 domain-containing protein [Pseudomonadota bacterium]